uniref:Acyltransferase 3 domain-containing protein n=1 Tax=Anopheles dirus TaxID=7168 RepID=A0A182NVK9_9DIPT
MNLLVRSGLVLSMALCGALCEHQHQQYSEGSSKLPRIYEYDDFRSCRAKYADFVYCVGVVELQADRSNELWKNISHLRSNRRNFPHDQLERGLCLNDYHDEVKYSRHAEVLINTYLSHKLYSQYGLASRTTLEACWTKESFAQSRTPGEVLFACIALALFGATMMATRTDLYVGASSVLVKAFSVRQNMRHLWEAPRPNALPFLEGLRALGTLTILIVHSELPMIRMPVRNTEHLEAQVNHAIFPLINSGNTHMIQFFFTLGGIVFGVSCLAHFERYPSFKFRYFIEKLLRRLVRLLPAYALIIFYQATWYKRVKQGPLEFKFNDYCTEHWWTNLLFINNYILPTKPCLQFSWYLGADLQLFLIGSLLMMVLWTNPGLKKTLVCMMIIAALFIPGYVIYAASTGPTMHALAELRTYDHFLKYYLPSHTNISSYFFGMIAAIYYRNIDFARSTDRIRSVLRRLMNVSLIVLCGLNAFTTLLPFVHVDKQNSIFNAIYGSLLKSSWGCCYSLLFLVLALSGKSLLIDILSHPAMQFFAKISYCVYIVQYAVIYGLYTNFPVPITYGTFNLIILASASFLLTLVCALLLYLAVEAPFSLIGNKCVAFLLRKDITAEERESKQSKLL